MALLEVTQTRYVSASVRLTETTALLLDQYAAFIKADADNVIEQGLCFVFTKDREFQDFLKTPEAAKVARTLRVRRATASESQRPQSKRPNSPSEAAETVRGSKA